MNREAQDFTRSHYDGHANKHQTQQQALQARRQGPSLPLKKFHNQIKRQLIQRFALGADSLLDLACGRGGDIWKWIDAQIGYVKGLDLSPGEIAEATKRFEEAKRSRPELALVAEFEATEELGKGEVRLGRTFDAVTCMFAIHYFFASEASLDAFFRNVAAHLKEGGFFFGTVPDGRRVSEVIHKFGRWPSYESPMLKLQARWQGEPRSFGCGYSCGIGDTVTEGHGDSTGSYEYLVFRSTLVGVAAKHGFRAVRHYEDPALEALFQPADAEECCKHFAPRFPQTGAMEVDTSLSQASKLNMAFVFQKLPAAAAAAAAVAAAQPAAKRKQPEGAQAPAPSPPPDLAGERRRQQQQQSRRAAGGSGSQGDPKRTRIG